MTKSKTWSEKDLKHMDTIIQGAPDITEGKKLAAEHFGVTYNSINIRYGRWLKGLKGKKKPTIKEPIVRKPREINSYKKKVISSAVKNNIERKITFAIKSVDVDLAKGKLTIIY